MLTGTAAACQLTGFVPRHADACASVASRLDTCVLFREPGQSAQSLIADGYAMKGFRIDTKSCTWGPMRGFVCVDPRLSKPTSTGGSYGEKNATWTAEALHGHIVEKFFGVVDATESADWKADVMPIVLSKARIDELNASGHLRAELHRGGGGNEYYVGVARQTFGATEVTLPYRLVSARGATNPWLAGQTEGYYVLCVEQASGFQQVLPGGARPILFRGFQTILGMCNPGSRHLGFKACVTADYDLFAIWPRRNDNTANALHQVNAAILARAGRAAAPLALNNVARMPRVDDRLQKAGHREHYRVGDVSARILQVRAQLNTAIVAAGYRGGNAVHHNDEQGNMALAKGSLAECLPVIAMLPYPPHVVALQNVGDFRSLVMQARAMGYDTRAKPSWLREAGLV